MSLKIARVEPASAEDWDCIWAGCDYATYYHSRHWAELWRDYAPGKHRPAPTLIMFSDGFQALLPLTKTRQAKGLIEIYESGPYNTYGGWIATDPLSTDHAALLGAFLRRLPNMNWMTNPFDPLANRMPHGEATHTRVFDLRQGLDGLGRSYRQYYRVAQRNGLTLRTLEASQADAAFGIHLENQTRWQMKRMLFDSRLYRLFFEMPYVDFMGVFDAHEKLLAIALALRSKRHIGLWLANAVRRSRVPMV